MLLEPNRMLGRKLRITGKGRCNVTNDCDAREFISAIPGDGRFLQSAIHRFGTSDTKALFEGLGVALKTERGNRVFPESDKADDIADALAELARKNGVRVLRERARHILTDESGAVCAVATERGEIECANAVICTGGLSYPGTGSTGDGYRMAQELGHTIRTCRPSLVPLESPDKWCREMQGFSLRNVELYAYEDDKLIYKALGEMLFTHFGVSGPLVLSASAHMRRFGECKYRLSIDLKPGLDDKKLDARLLRDFEKYNNREFRNSLGDLAGRMMIPTVPFKECYFLEDALRFRKELKLPLVYVGGVVSRANVETVLDSGFEFVQMGRALVTQPDFVNRMRENDGDMACSSGCEHKNYCIGRMYTIDMKCHKHVPDLPAKLRKEMERIK